MLKKLFLLTSLFLFLFGHLAIAQEAEEDDRPVFDPYACGRLVDNQTVVNPYGKTFEVIIQHRFGEIEEINDLFGIYAPSNIRLGVNYGITDNIMVGFGTEKNNKLQDFQGKWTFLQQTTSGRIPVSVAAYGNMAIDARDDEVFGQNYAFTNRLSYFAQVIISRKFSDRISLLVAPSFSHVNAADSLIDHDKIGISVGGRIKFYNEMSFIFEYDHPLHLEQIREYTDPFESKPNLALGIEIGTLTHAFQIYVAPFDKIVPQHNYIYNENDFTDGGMRFGFNIIARL